MMIRVADSLIAKLKVYRERRKIERGGKAMQNDFAVNEILRAALNGYTTDKFVSLEDWQERLRIVEGKIDAMESPPDA